jgi:hypothetical protein
MRQHLANLATSRPNVVTSSTESAAYTFVRIRGSLNLRRLALVLTLILAPVGSGLVGYYVGQQSRSPTSTTFPVWTDEEVRNVAAGGGTTVLYLHCTYHKADGTIQVREFKLPTVISSPGPCPSAP